MKANYNYKLIDGEFSPSEAKKILMDLINTKINYHNLDGFSNHIRFNAAISHHENRVEQLSQTRESIKILTELAANYNLKLKISSEIIIELIENV